MRFAEFGGIFRRNAGKGGCCNRRWRYSNLYTNFQKGEGEEKRNRYTIKVNNNDEEFFNFSPDALKMTGGNLIVESKVGDWLDWQGTGGIDISGGTVSAKMKKL